MLGLPVHPSADLGQVGEHGLLRSFPGHLGRDQGELLLVTSELGVVRVEQRVESVEEFRVSVVPAGSNPGFLADLGRGRSGVGARGKDVVAEFSFGNIVVTLSVLVGLGLSDLALVRMTVAIAISVNG